MHSKSSTCWTWSQNWTTAAYFIWLVDVNKDEHLVLAYSLESISAAVEKVDISAVVNVFKGINKSNLERPEGPVDLLIDSN